MNFESRRRSSRQSTKSPLSTDEECSCDSKHEVIRLYKHKTELCKTFSLMGYCSYEQKCRFAHGLQEIVENKRCQQKQKQCKGFWQFGRCCYGSRCLFGHALIDWRDKCCLLALQSRVGGGLTSRLLPLL